MNIKPLLLAFGLLTRIPLPKQLFSSEFSERDYKLSALYYPFIGFIIGLILVFIAWFGASLESSSLSAALVLCAWVAITGALHLDGLSDCTDAYFSAHKSPQTALEVMKDPHVGSVGVVALICVLILKFSLLETLFKHGNSLALPFVLAISRLNTIFYMSTSQYVRKEGLASKIQVNHLGAYIVGITITLFLLCFVFFGANFSIALFVVLALHLFLWRRLWNKLINGYTGDCLGAQIEVAEVIGLMIAIIFIH